MTVEAEQRAVFITQEGKVTTFDLSCECNIDELIDFLTRFKREYQSKNQYQINEPIRCRIKDGNITVKERIGLSSDWLGVG